MQPLVNLDNEIMVVESKDGSLEIYFRINRWIKQFYNLQILMILFKLLSIFKLQNFLQSFHCKNYNDDL